MERLWCPLGTSIADYLITSSDVASRLRLRSANRHQLIVPRCRLNTCIRPSGVFDRWSDGLELAACRVFLTVLSSFLRQSCLVFTNVTSALEVFLNVMRYINLRFTYLPVLPLYVSHMSRCVIVVGTDDSRVADVRAAWSKNRNGYE